MKIKDFYLSMLSENKDFFYIDSQSIGDIKDISINKTEDYIKIDFITTYGKPASLETKYTDFKNWYGNNIDMFNDVFKSFVQDYLKNSKELESEPESEPESESQVNEIIDDAGNIMSSDDKPNNSTNSMVGSKNVWDLEKLYKSVRQSRRKYSGTIGMGSITW